MTKEQPLAGCRVLVVEDEFLIADHLHHSLERSGAEVVGPIGNLTASMRQVAAGGFEVAVVDLNLRDEMACPLVQMLKRRNVPFVFATGYSEAAIPAEFADVRRWEKVCAPGNRPDRSEPGRFGRMLLSAAEWS